MGKFLNLHKRLLSTKLKKSNGLCSEYFEDGTRLKHTMEFSLVSPSEQEKIKLRLDGFCRTYWASGEKDLSNSSCDWDVLYEYQKKRDQEYSPLRQNLILLCAALNGEFDER